MDLSNLLLYLARGALTAFEVITESLSRSDLKSLRYISFEVSDVLVPYLFDKSDELHISAYGPDVNVAQAVLANPLLGCRVQKLIWDYSVLDPELLRYAWYNSVGKQVVGDQWQGLCSFIYDHTYIATHGIDVHTLEQALSCPNVFSLRVVNCNLYKTLDPTNITLCRDESVANSLTTAMFSNGPYTINLLKSATPFPSPFYNLEGTWAPFENTKAGPGRFQSLIYRGDCGTLSCCCWLYRASPDRVTTLLTAMAQTPNLQLREFIVSSSKSSECGKEEAWARAFRAIPSQKLTAWNSKFVFVERLQLFLDDGGYIQPCTADRDCLQEHFRPVLQAARNIEDLQITGVGWEVVAMLEGLYPRLRRLFIEIANLQYISLTTFCQRHVETLRVLDIRNSQLNGGPWQQFLFLLAGGTILPLNEISSHNLNATEGQTLDLQLHKVFDEVNLDYQGTRCVFQKSILPSSQNAGVRLQHKEGSVHLKRLQLRLSVPPEHLCRVHQYENSPYAAAGSSTLWYRTIHLMDYR